MGSVAQPDEHLKNLHVFMVSFPGQGHLNPLLRLGKRLSDFGLFITFSAPKSASLSIRKANNIADDEHEPTPLGRGMIRFEFFDDGWDFDDPNQKDFEAYMAQLELAGREKLPQMIEKQLARGRPVSCLINNPFIPWVSDVAEILGIPSAMLWVQSCACFSVYYHYYNNLIPFPSEKDEEIDVQLPFMPLLKHDEIPSFLHPKQSQYSFLKTAILGQYKNLSKPFCILMDTFQELENEIIEYMSKISRPIKTVGPLFKSSSNSNSDDAIRVDFYAVENCVEWLDTKPPCTVVYISFGSVVHLEQEQIDEIAHGLLLSEVSFLWVMKPPNPLNAGSEASHILPEGFLERAGDKGKIVRWAPQDGVLAHPATACFVTHCGWNSTVEAMTSGVPVVAFPGWGDQVSNAKFLVDVFKVGVRLSRGSAEGRIVRRDEVEMCLRATTCGSETVELRENAIKWKKAAEEAVAEGGSSYRNMKEFVDEVARMSRNE